MSHVDESRSQHRPTKLRRAGTIPRLFYCFNFLTQRRPDAAGRKSDAAGADTSAAPEVMDGAASEIAVSEGAGLAGAGLSAAGNRWRTSTPAVAVAGCIASAATSAASPAASEASAR